MFELVQRKEGEYNVHVRLSVYQLSVKPSVAN